MLRTDAPKVVYLKDYQKPDWLAPTLNLVFRIFDDAVEVTCVTHFKKNHDNGLRPLILSGEHMGLISLRCNDQEIEFKKTEKELIITPPADEFDLTIITRIDPANNLSLEGLYKSGGTYCTQCEPEGFRRITYAIDRPDNLSIFTVRIEADAARYPVLLSNGNLIEEGTLENNRHFTTWHDPYPKPCYLFALVAGDLKYIHDSYTTMTGRIVDLRIYVREEDLGQCDHAMESLKKSFAWDEDVYGREYQLNRFNIVAVSDFNFGAMENTSLNIFNTALVLAHPETATDADFLNVEAVVAHEYFHNWSGNRVTCRDWFQLSLKEGFTVFREQEFSSDMNSRAVKRIDDVVALRTRQFPEDQGPLAHPIRPDSFIEINNFYTMTVYEKGGEVIRMQRNLLGSENFRKGTDLYFDRFDGQAVTCDGFVQCMEDAGNIDLSQFKKWYSQAGTPHLHADFNYDASQKIVRIAFTQNTPPTPGQDKKLPLHIPVSFALFSPNGDCTHETVLHVTQDKQEFVFENMTARPVPSILRGFSAPVKLTSNLEENDLAFLSVHDTDGFNRWDSLQTLYLRFLQKAVKAYESDIKPPFPDSLLSIIGDVLKQAQDPSQDRALLARMLTLPDFTVLAQEQDIVNPDAIYKALEFLKTEIAQKFHSEISNIYNSVTSITTYSTDPNAMADRALKRVMLKYLTYAEVDHGFALAKNLYNTANNMTDRMTAFSIIVDTETTYKQSIIDDFYSRFRSYPLVIDKWFSTQAMSKSKTIFDDIKQLGQHKDFTLRNPNRARSLYGAFFVNNPVAFHHASGDGYNLIKNIVLEIDGFNPSLASRLLSALRDWKRFTPDRQIMMKKVLEEIVAHPTLSPNCFEIASKSLNA
jgi:aminopeptidase N